MSAVEQSINIIEDPEGELRVSSLIIAGRTQREHEPILRLIRDNVSDFEEFGRVSFENGPFETRGGTQMKSFALLNEQQATLLITYMRNNDAVRAFKVELVKQFYAMRQALTASRQPVELDRRQLALMVIEAEDAREAAEQRAAVESARADATQKILDNVERKDGLVVRAWIGKYFLSRQERMIWELFYRKRLLKDGRGKGGADRKGKPKSSRDHQAVYTDGFPFFIRTPKDYQVGDGVIREETRVRPGRAELELVAYCERAGIAPLPEVSQALFEIADLSTVFESPRGIAA